MGQEDYRRLNSVEDKIRQALRNPLKCHFTLLNKYQEVSGPQGEKKYHQNRELTEVPPSVSIQDMEEKAYRQWWAGDACPPHDPFLLEPS